MTAQAPAAQFLRIPLDKLELCPDQVRQHKANGIEALAKSIEVSGLLQNLVVSSDGDGTYPVHAGSRRLRALQLLRDRGAIPADHPVPCQTIARGNAIAAGLAENTLREAMHPADEFEAFRKLVDAGEPVEDVAAAFGVTPLVVRQRLKLANCAPFLIEAYRKGETTLEALTAFALSDDHAEQERVWKAIGKHSRASAWTIRNALTEKDLPATDKRVHFVGLDAYEAAGGPVRRDLFDDRSGGGYVCDVPLLERLVTEKLEKKAEKVRKEGFAWVEVRPNLPYEERYRYQESPQQRTDEAKATTGAIITVDHSGKAETLRFLLKPGQKPGAAPGAAPSQEAPKRPDLSDNFVRRLTAHRTAALQRVLYDHPKVALALLVHRLGDHLVFVHSATSVLQISRGHPDVGIHIEGLGADVGGSRARTEFRQLVSDWRDKVPGKAAEQLAWLMAQSEADLLQLLALCTASQISAVHGLDGKLPMADQVAALVGLDMADYWEATPDTFLGTVPAAVTIQAVAEACGKDVAATLNGLKKKDLVAKAAGLLSGTRWLPKPLRGPKATAPKKAPAKAAAKKTASKAAPKKRSAKAPAPLPAPVTT